MSQHKVILDVAARAEAHRLAAAMTDLMEPAPDALTLFEDGAQWRIEAYYPEAQDTGALARELAHLTGLAVPEARCEAVVEQNWVAMSQAALPPVRAGRFTVHGSHDRARVGGGPNAIEIDAGEAFGTAHHATTSGCLEAISQLQVLQRQGGRHWRRVLDLGTGSGVLAIALARLLEGTEIVATDVDTRSVEVAADNARANGAGGRIRFAVASGTAHPLVRNGARFDAIVANILAGPLIALAGDITARLRPRGVLVLSGILIPQAPAVLAAYCARGMVVERHNRIAGWSTLILVKASR